MVRARDVPVDGGRVVPCHTAGALVRPDGRNPTMRCCSCSDWPTSVITARPGRLENPTSPWTMMPVGMSVSLDHSVWFHRPVDVNRWLLSELDAGGHRTRQGAVDRHDPHCRRAPLRHGGPSGALAAR